MLLREHLDGERAMSKIYGVYIMGVQYAEIRLDKETVYNCEDRNQLEDWLEDLDEAAEEVKASLEAMSLVPGYDVINIGRKLGYLKIARTWVVRQMQGLGFMEEEKVAQLGKQIFDLGNVIRGLKSENASLKFKLEQAGIQAGG